jgi:hypothetical protein
MDGVLVASATLGARAAEQAGAPSGGSGAGDGGGGHGGAISAVPARALCDAGPQKSAREYAATGARTLSPVLAGSVLVLGDSNGSDTALGKALGAGATLAWLGMFHSLPWLRPFVVLLWTLSLVFGTAAIFDVAALRGWTAGWLIFAAGVPTLLTVYTLMRPSVLWALLFTFDAWFLSLTAIAGCLAQAYALDNRFDDRAPFLLGVACPYLLLIVLSDAARETHRRIAAALSFIGAGSTLSFMVAMCTRPASKIDVDLEVLPSFAWGVSKIALSAASTLTLFLLRMGLVLLLRPAERVILGAPLRMMPASDEEAAADRGEPAYGGLRASAELPAGSRVLAPGDDADIVFNSRATVARALLGQRRADALWGVNKRWGLHLYTGWAVGAVLGMCFFFDVAVSVEVVVVTVLLVMPLLLFGYAFMNAELLLRVSGRFDVLFLVGEVLAAHVSFAAFFKWDLRAVAFFGCWLPSVLLVCLIDAWHPVARRVAWVGVLVGFISICAAIASIATHPALAANAAVWQLGSLGYKVGQLAFDTWKVVAFFFAKNLVMYLRWPARYSQLRAPLVEQVVPPPPVPAEAQEELVASIGGGM